MSLSFITDRTQVDVNRANDIKGKYTAGGWDSLTASEQAAFKAGLKGSYNDTDLNRVGNALTELRDLLTSRGYEVSVDVRTDWTEKEWPTKETMGAYVQSIRNIRSMLTELETTPAVPDGMDDLTWQTANDIEKILADVDDALDRMARTWFYAGEIYGGEQP
jgi:hypothetical protein